VPTVAIASNFDARLPEVLESLGILPTLAQFAIASGTMGAAKPAPQYYDAVVAAAVDHGVFQSPAEASPDTVWMIGDHPENDMRGPREAGWRGVHLDRSAPISNILDSIASLDVIRDELVALSRAGP
jgi:FMN phosphatase YigB (HAD superfamily)